MDKKISVIIPVYNVEEYLRECLDSIINQPFKDIEIICVNDGSTDNSLEILNEYAQKDDRFVVISQENQGQGVARNKGLDIAQGEYILFVDPDDYICKNILETMYNSAKKNNSDFLMSQTIAFKDKSDKYNKSSVNPNRIKTFRITKDKFLEIIETYPCVAWGNLYKNEFIQTNKLRFIKDKVIHEDNGFFIKVCACKPILTMIEDVCVMYRIRPNSTMSSIKGHKNKSEKAMICIINDALNYINEEINSDYEFYKTKILNESSYSKHFGIDIPFLFKFIWTKNNKRIQIAFIRIYREKISKNKRIIKLFCIPIFIKQVDNWN